MVGSTFFTESLSGGREPQVLGVQDVHGKAKLTIEWNEDQKLPIVRTWLEDEQGNVMKFESESERFAIVTLRDDRGNAIKEFRMERDEEGVFAASWDDFHNVEQQLLLAKSQVTVSGNNVESDELTVVTLEKNTIRTERANDDDERSWLWLHVLAWLLAIGIIVKLILDRRHTAQGEAK